MFKESINKPGLQKMTKRQFKTYKNELFADVYIQYKTMYISPNTNKKAPPSIMESKYEQDIITNT